MIIINEIRRNQNKEYDNQITLFVIQQATYLYVHHGSSFKCVFADFPDSHNDYVGRSWCSLKNFVHRIIVAANHNRHACWSHVKKMNRLIKMTE